MGLNDVAADRQAHAHAALPRREEWLEDPFQISRRYAAPAIFNFHPDFRRPQNRRAQPEDAVFGRDQRQRMAVQLKPVIDRQNERVGEDFAKQFYAEVQKLRTGVAAK